ncbi:MAG: hypothetical protein PWR15_359 [Bacteroidota bacterium]|jgi:hypothetical protein|nr:hypothetical protein [Bacteroidota bacterium]
MFRCLSQNHLKKYNIFIMLIITLFINILQMLRNEPNLYKKSPNHKFELLRY